MIEPILAVVELDDLLFIDILGQLSAFRQTNIFAFECCISIFQVSWKVIAVFQSFLDGLHGTASFAKTDYITNAYTVRSDVDFFAVNSYVAMGYQLTCACTGVSKAKTVNQVVQTAFEQEHEVFARDTLELLSFGEQSAELLLAQTVHVTEFLFFQKLHSVVTYFSALVSAVLTRRERAFQVFACTAKGNAQTAAEFEFRSGVTCHIKVDSFIIEISW